MNAWYALVDSLLPFSWAGPLFMRTALLAVLVVTPLLALMGTQVVNSRLAFFADSIGHSTLTGLALGVLCGYGQQPLPVMAAFAALFAILLAVVRRYSDASTDTIVGVFASTGVALGIVLLSRGGGFARYTAWLIGDLLSITPNEIAAFTGLGLVILMAGAWLGNDLLLCTVSPALARSRGIRVWLTETAFIVLLAEVVAFAASWVGILIINALLVLPAAAARNLARGYPVYVALSLLSGLVTGVLGLILAWYWDTAPSATIVLLAAGWYFFTVAVRGARR